MFTLNKLFFFALLSISFLVNSSLIAQCPFPVMSLGSGNAPTTPGQSVLMETCNFTNETVTVMGVQAGANYLVEYFNGSGVYVVVYNTAQIPVAWGFSPIIFTAPTSGTYYSSSFLGTSCGGDFSTCNASTWTNMLPGTYEYVTGCGDYTWLFNGQTYNSPGTYVDSVSNGGGYDVMYLGLTIDTTIFNPALNYSAGFFTSEQSSGTYQWIDCSTNLPISGETSQTFEPTQSGSYAVILSNGNCTDTSGCSQVNFESASNCYEYTWALNNQTYYNSGIYFDSVLTPGGYEYSTLDLTIVIGTNQLSVVNSSSTLISQLPPMPSGTYQWIDCSTNLPINGATSQSFTPTQSGTYAVILSSFSCTDTSVCTTVLLPTFEVGYGCSSSYTWAFNNQTYTTAGLYSDSVLVAGTYQVANLYVIIVFSPSDLIVVDSANTLTSQFVSGTYQWIDCSTNLPITGATSQSFTPTQSGSYAVVISGSGCVDTSACTTVEFAGLENLDQFYFSIVPNPTKDIVTISFDGSSAELLITDLRGSIIHSEEVQSGKKIDMTSFDSGVYLFNLNYKGQTEILRVIRE